MSWLFIENIQRRFCIIIRNMSVLYLSRETELLRARVFRANLSCNVAAAPEITLKRGWNIISIAITIKKITVKSLTDWVINGGMKRFKSVSRGLNKRLLLWLKKAIRKDFWKWTSVEKIGVESFSSGVFFWIREKCDGRHECV